MGRMILATLWRDLCDLPNCTRADLRALPKVYRYVRDWLARYAVDWLGDEIQQVLLMRQFARRMDELGASIYCPMHDCDWKDCPPVCHDDD